MFSSDVRSNNIGWRAPAGSAPKGPHIALCSNLPMSKSHFSRARIDPTSPFTVEEANVGNRIAKRTLLRATLLCASTNRVHVRSKALSRHVGPPLGRSDSSQDLTNGYILIALATGRSEHFLALDLTEHVQWEPWLLHQGGGGSIGDDRLNGVSGIVLEQFTAVAIEPNLQAASSTEPGRAQIPHRKRGF